ncbi:MULTISPECIES: hypothetical protein [Bacillus]|uniref:Uncharacterized protein n=2 Tax=Bacillus cereus group TaxID=86661 RepID=A0A2C1DQQ4_BACCE|nr:MULTISPECIES: hypothetical protein [Bacillus cereus group]OFD71115.1 hypothetical protein BWGOE9_51610 [Bacillus mycoides]OFD71786.1 hypothetical protein BWGOE8_50560 [Bacillus mycoides]OFD74739.1 hypothetical protein BWGOE10_51180 [Bacillus mycoides]PGT02279.1 hypothetical protein COD09_11965 [Bacillus cereus]
MNKKMLFPYALIKFSAACSLFFSFLLFFFIGSDMNFFKTSEYLTGFIYIFWFYLLFLYAILCSVIIDKLNSKRNSTPRTILLYILCGYLFFLPFHIYNGGDVIIIFIMGSVGAICSLFFYLCTCIANKSKWFRYMTAIIIPILFIAICSIDFTQKEQWVEHSTKNTFEADFSYFNGTHKIPVYVKKGETLEVNVNFLITENSAYQGYGTGFSSEFNKYEPLSELSDDTYELSPSKTGTYYIEVTGYGIEGKIKTNWIIK